MQPWAYYNAWFENLSNFFPAMICKDPNLVAI